MSNWHIHVYFAETEIELAREVRENLISLLPQLTYQGQLINQPVGPHPVPMFELHLPETELASATPVIDANRQGLSVLIHPLLEDEVVAHTTAARWLGKKLPLDLDMLIRFMEQKKNSALTPRNKPV